MKKRKYVSLEKKRFIPTEIGFMVKKILVENINYSPIFLECFWKRGLCEFCLDTGHLMLGRESVLKVAEQFMSVTREVHLHGVQGYQEHLSLVVLPEARVSKWISLFVENSFKGVVNLEVFNEGDLEASIRMLNELFSPGLSGSTFRVPG